MKHRRDDRLVHKYPTELDFEAREQDRWYVRLFSGPFIRYRTSAHVLTHCVRSSDRMFVHSF